MIRSKWAVGAFRASHLNFLLFISVGLSRHTTASWRAELRIATSYVIVEMTSESAQEEQISANAPFAPRARTMSPGATSVDRYVDLVLLPVSSLLEDKHESTSILLG